MHDQPGFSCFSSPFGPELLADSPKTAFCHSFCHPKNPSNFSYFEGPYENYTAIVERTERMAKAALSPLTIGDVEIPIDEGLVQNVKLIHPGNIPPSSFNCIETITCGEVVFPRGCFVDDPQPSPLTLSQVIEKICHLRVDHPEFHPLISAYNRHGVVLLGYFKENLGLLWASPRDVKVRKIACESITYTKEKDCWEVMSLDPFLHLQVTNFNVQLNHEGAISIFSGDESS